MANDNLNERKRRRPRGSGSIFYMDSRKAWIGRKMVGGVRIQVSGKSRSEVARKLENAVPPGPTTTIAQWSERWLSQLNAKPGTHRSYKKSLVHIVEHLGSIRVTDLTPTRVEAFATELIRAGLHVNTVRKTIAELRNLLSGAVRDGLIATNPAAIARKPTGQRKEIDPFTVEELSRIIATATRLSAYRIIAFLAGCGCRAGEALALDVPDYDPTTNTVSITKTYDGALGIGSPKSKHSKRVIVVPAPVIPAVRAAIADRTRGPLFVSGAGRRRVLELVRQAWVRLLDRLGLRFRNLHQLRHSVASHLIAAGVPIGEVAAYLGDTPETIVRTYLHATGHVDVAGKLGEILSGKTNPPR